MGATIIVLIVIGWLIPWALANSISKDKGRGGQGWLLGFVLGWIGVLIIALLPRIGGAPSYAKEAPADPIVEGQQGQKRNRVWR